MRNEPAPDTALGNEDHAEDIDLNVGIHFRDIKRRDQKRINGIQSNPDSDRYDQHNGYSSVSFPHYLEKEKEGCKKIRYYPAIDYEKSHSPGICTAFDLKKVNWNVRFIYQKMQIVCECNNIDKSYGDLQAA